ncbi:MAG TPA: hypothetical protein PLX69_25010 [Leptospiraceae bacterium]|nr:hypothetical protein [Leptospiraceae bacterium]
MPTELTFLNLRENLKLLLGMQNITYIFNTQKELNAINKFTMEGFKPDYVIELIGKLIEIKRHAKFKKDSFWQGCAVNLSDAYNYRVKIETVYPTIATITPPTVGVENFQPATTNQPANTIKFPTDPWENFIHWTKKLTKSSQAEINQLTAVIQDKLIVVSGNPPEQLQKFITNYWTNAGYTIVYKVANGRDHSQQGETNDQT